MSVPTSKHSVVDQSLSSPLTRRKMNTLDDSNNCQHNPRSIFSASQSKGALACGISPKINHHKIPTSNTYNPPSVETQ